MLSNSKEAALKEKFKSLKEQYKKNLAQKKHSLKKTWAAILANDNVDSNLKELYLILHNLSGTGNTFGFNQVTEHARLLEYIVKTFQSDNFALNTEQIDQLSILINNLFDVLDNPVETEYSATEHIGHINDGTQDLIYLVDDDSFFVNELSLQLTSAGYQVKGFSEPKQILESGKQDRPSLIIMDMMFTNSDLEGAQIIEKYKQTIDSNVLVVFISVWDDLDSRLRALRSGSDYYLLKPLDFEHLINVLEHVLTKKNKSPYRVLVVDDDEVILTYYKTVLTEAGIVAEGVTHPQQVLGIIKELEPELILLDVNMPYCNGIEMANIIRQFPKLISLPIIFLTTETSVNIKQSAWDLGADEYILKPISPKQLIQIVTSRTKRARQLKDISFELMENKSRTNNIMETLHDVIWSADTKNWALSYISTSCVSVLGKTDAELTQSANWRDFVHLDDQTFVKQEIEKLAHQDGLEIVYRVIGTDGSIRWVLENIQKVLSPRTKIPRFDGIIHDITSREIDKQHIKRRLKLESELAVFTRSLLQNHDFDQAFDCLLKMSDATVVQIFHIQSQPGKKDEYISLFRTGDAKYANQVESTIAELKLSSAIESLHSGNPQFVTGLHPNYPDNHENLLLPIMIDSYWFGFISFILPQSNPYHNEEELAILKSASEIIANFFEKEQNVAEKKKQDKLLDVAGRISRILLMETDYKKAFSTSLNLLKEVVQYNELYLIKRSHDEYIFDPLAYSVSDALFSTVNDFKDIWLSACQKFEPKISKKQSIILAHDKIQELLELNNININHLVIIPIAHANSILGVLIMLTNKHEFHLKKQFLSILESVADSFGGALVRQQTQEELITAKNQSELANRSKSEFLANMSHEIRTPMNAILGFAQLMKSSPQDEEKEEYADLILDSGSKLLSLITDVMDLSNVEIGKTHLNKGELKPDIFAKAVLKQHEKAIKHNNLELELTIQDKIPNVITDVEKIIKIADCLLSNAIKFTEKGKISLQLSVQELAQDSFSFILKVTDTGIGINSEKQKVIFDAFEQADTSKTRRYSGIGLGLTITSRLVKVLNGDINLESQVGKGSTFTVTIPVELAPKIEETESTKKDTAPLNKIKILAAEDNKINRILLSKVLSGDKYLFYTVENGAEAIDFLLKNPDIDMVLMDVHMPVMSGTEATQVIKKTDSIKHIPIVALTASVLQEDINLCFEAGMDDFLEKPLHIDNLYAVIDKWCS
jgi:CheY-like chemotaxis protein